MDNKKTAIIIGAGPAGLTAAYELVCRSNIHCIIIEQSSMCGGISKTYNYKGNYIDLGGHRFFSKSDRVMDWWLNILPLQKIDHPGDVVISYHNKKKIVEASVSGPDPLREKRLMLLRHRLSRIYYSRRFFDYPVKLNGNTIKNLGLVRMTGIAFSYGYSLIIKRKPEKSLEDFFINRFGKRLYETFFKDYTEKVWGVPCHEISAEWGAQRIKGLSAGKAVWHAMTSMLRIKKRKVETTLIEQFLYPKFGPGQLWETVAAEVKEKGGEIIFNQRVLSVKAVGKTIVGVNVIDASGQQTFIEGDYFFSTMPVKDLIRDWQGDVPVKVKQVAEGLGYRDFISVGMLYKKLNNGPLPDNWIYVQEPDVKLGRIQVFNNWSPYMVKDPDTFWIGLEYFCKEGDEIWSLTDEKMLDMAAGELEKISIAHKSDLLDGVVYREAKTYPAYFGTHIEFNFVREFTDQFSNLFLVGRNGMHKYNNQDHSMLTAMMAVDNILAGITDKSNIWDVNTEQDYHEEKK